MTTTLGLVAGAPAPLLHRRAPADSRRIDAAGLPTALVSYGFTLASTTTLTSLPLVAAIPPTGTNLNQTFYLEYFDQSAAAANQFLGALMSSGTQNGAITFTAPSGSFTVKGGDNYVVELVTASHFTGTVIPTPTPTGNPTTSPTVSPTGVPTASPTTTPTANPTTSPTVSPTTIPTAAPTPTGTPGFATSTEAMANAGGTLTLPAYGAYTGSIVYPPFTSTGSVSAVLTSSTSNYNGHLHPRQARRRCTTCNSNSTAPLPTMSSPSARAAVAAAASVPPCSRSVPRIAFPRIKEREAITRRRHS